jgi:hypothetical protein
MFVAPTTNRAESQTPPAEIRAAQLPAAGSTADMPARSERESAFAGSFEPNAVVGIRPTFVNAWDGLPQVPSQFSLPASTTRLPAMISGSGQSLDQEELPQHSWNLATHVTHPVDAYLVDAAEPLMFYGEFDGIAGSEICGLPQCQPETVIDTECVVPSVESILKNPAAAHPEPRQRWSKRDPLERLGGLVRRKTGWDLGLGSERVMFAPMVVETAMGTPHSGLQIRSGRGLATPDRLEYIWATPSRGPSAESSVDILDTVLHMELGNEKAMAITEMSMRSLNPERNDNTVGFGDMVVGARATLMDGRCTKVASVFRTYIKTGPADRGLGTGHVSLEPGMLVRHQWSQYTFFHGEVKYWLPIAGTPGTAGDVLKAGAAVSTVWHETDTFALMPTLEFSSLTFLSGAATNLDGSSRRVNGEFVGEIYPGLRCVWGPGGDLGLIEYGVSPGFILADEGWYDSRLIFDIRFVR